MAADIDNKLLIVGTTFPYLNDQWEKNWEAFGKSIASEWPGEEGFELWWSYYRDHCSELGETAAKERWQTFAGNKDYTLGFILHIAKKKGWPGYQRYKKLFAEIEPEHPVEGTGEPARNQDGDLPVIQSSWQLREAVCSIWTHLLQRNKTALNDGTVTPGKEPLFLTAGDAALARIIWHTSPLGDRLLDIERMTQTQVAGLLTREFNWKSGPKNKDPKRSCIEQIHGDAVHAPEPIPVISQITRTPIYSRNGTPIHKRGYHPDENLWYEPDPELAHMAPVPIFPQDADIEGARYLLDEAVDGFPFTSSAEKATILAAILMPFVRRLIDGPTPIHLIESPVQGSGKSLLARIVAILTTGAAISPIVLNDNQEESQKALAAELARGRQMIIIDNVDTSRASLKSPALSAIATETVYSARKLGSSEMLELPNRCLWILTGNNIRFSQDLIRRFIRCRLDPGSEQPWTRPSSDFKHPDIIRWVCEHRSDLTWAALTLCQAWIARGRPPGPKTLGSYESWSSTMSGILFIAGIPDFLENLDDFYGAANSEQDSWSPFILKWIERFGGNPCSAKELNKLCADYSESGDMLMARVRGDKGELSQQQRLAKALITNRERIIDGYRICCAKNAHSKGWEYSLRNQDGTSIPGPDGKPVPSQLGMDLSNKGVNDEV